MNLARYNDAGSASDIACDFDPITLDALNAKAAMMERVDNKYVVTTPVLVAMTADLAAQFDVLEIGGNRTFEYKTYYFDDVAMSSYFDHLHGRRRRYKVRTRHYADAGQCFVEMKLKDRRGGTIKKRMPYPVEKYGQLDERASAHIAKSFQEQYSTDLVSALRPSLEVRYQRTQLVAKLGGERLTIDSNLRFLSAACIETAIAADRHIVETKSSNGNGLADKLLRRYHQHPLKGCSKYCAGMAATGAVPRYNKFLPALRRLDAVPLRQD